MSERNDDDTDDNRPVNPPHSLRTTWRHVCRFSLDNERMCDQTSAAAYFLRSLCIALVESRIGKGYYHVKDGDIDERETSILWTPAQGLCADLEIAPSHLNRLVKEYSGLTVQQMCDRQRCWTDEIHEKLTAEVARFIRARFVPGNCGAGLTLDSELDVKAQQLEFWRAWREYRKSKLGWDNGSWARQYGFSSYQRFRTAFMLAFKKTPIEYEAQVEYRKPPSISVRSIR